MINYSRHFLFLSLIFLSSCATIRNEISSAGGTGSTRVLYIIGGIFLLAIAIILVFVLNYAMKRWRFLELVKPGLWLARLPVIGPYMSKALGAQRDLRQIANFDKTLKRYGVDSRDVTGTVKKASGGGSSAKLNQFLPKEVQQLTRGKKVSAGDLQQKGQGLLSRLLPGGNGEEEQLEPAHDDSFVGLSESASAATIAYLTDPVETVPTIQPSVAAAVASVVVSTPAGQNLAGTFDPTKPVLIVSIPHAADQHFPILSPSIIVGSDPDSDIHLSEPGVGGQHVQIDQTEFGWSVTDLGALGGTYLDSSQLLTNVPELWTKEYPINIGPIALRLVELSHSEFDEMFNRATNIERPGITIFPSEQTCEAGQTSVWQLHITNQGKAVDHFAVIVSGITAGWVELEQTQKPLMPGESTMISMMITPPRLSSSTAGVHTGSIRVQAISAYELFEVAEFKLDIEPFEAWETELSHHQLKLDTKASVIIRNGGNHEASIQMTAESESERFDLNPFETEQSYSLVAGGENAVPLSIKNLKRPFFGMRRNESFALSAVSAAGDYSIQHPGVFEIRPIVPTWLVSIVGFLLPFVCLIATIGYTFTENRNATATATAEAIALANLALTPTPTAIPTATPKPIVYPTSCFQLKGYLQQIGEDPDPDTGWVDGEFELYANGDLNLPMMIYCHEMASNDPKEFVSLQEVGNQNNFSRYTYPDGEIEVQFEKIRVDTANLSIDTTDRTFATTTDSRLEQVFDPPDYGSAKGCTSEKGRPIQGLANINLVGTQFSIPQADQLYMAEGKAMTEPEIVSSANGQVVDLGINGSCGWLYPNGDLQLFLMSQ